MAAESQPPKGTGLEKRSGGDCTQKNRQQQPRAQQATRQRADISPNLEIGSTGIAKQQQHQT